MAEAGPTWRRPSEAVRVVLHPPHLRSTTVTALVVGTLLFAINQLDVVMRGEGTALVWAKAAITYLVPFCVANVGVLIGAREAGPHDG